MVKLFHTAALLSLLLLCQVSTQDEICGDQFGALALCTDGDACLECLDMETQDEPMECSDGQDLFCAAFHKCDCGSCDKEVLALGDCLLDNLAGGEACQLDCSGTSAKQLASASVLICGMILALVC